MVKALVIVESPTKIKTLKKFLGKDYTFASSVGHIRDLPEKGFGIDVDHEFEPEYAILSGKNEVIKELKKAAKEVDVVYLAPDPDREGEAIAWHIRQILPKKTKTKRVAFHAITKEAVSDALQNPREINMALVNAQQARRLLDRIVGYKLSPLLARKLLQRSGVSAGRVQSVALKLVVDREKEIEAFKPVEYWNISSQLFADGKTSFIARLYSIEGKKWEKEPHPKKDVALIDNEKRALEIKKRLEKAHYEISSVERKEKKRHPAPPFITSTLQQEASRHFRFSASRTMTVAQQLYEGVELGSKGHEGLITYMRTDSPRIAPEAIKAVRSEIVKQYGKELLPEKPRSYTGKKSAQDAHEAIRPTNLANTPNSLKSHLSPDQFKLYSLIWKRFFASQMESAIYDTLTAQIATDQEIEMRATGSVLKFPGFLAVYEEKIDEEEPDKDEARLPPLTEESKLTLQQVLTEQAFTKPPPRFTEASLVKELEKCGIGRPSTYASIMNKIQGREYTTKEKQRLQPTELGRVIAEFLEVNFAEIMSIGFTASMENTLEEVAENHKEWKEVIKEFYSGFMPTVEKAQEEAFIPRVITDTPCPECKKGKLQKIWSRRGYFLGCTEYPECGYTTSEAEQAFNREDYAEDFDWDQACPLDNAPMNLRHGRFGPFLGCSNYPDCKGIVNIPKKGEQVIAEKDLPPCPAVGCPGKLKQRKSRFGKMFFSCSTYPECDVIVNQLEQLQEKYGSDHPRTAYVKKPRKTRTKKKKG